MTAQIITIIRDDKGQLLRTMFGKATQFNEGHLCTAASASFNESLARTREVSELVKTQRPHHD